MKKIWIGLFLLLCTFFVARYIIVGQAVYGDGIYYWSYVRSLYFDHDLNFFNEIGHRYNPYENNALTIRPPEPYDEITVNNYAANRYPPGAPLSWYVFFALGDIVARSLDFVGAPIAINGYSNIYQITVGVGNVLFVIIGLVFTYKLIRRYFSHQISFFTTSVWLFATNLFYYGSLDVINSHPFSFMIAAIYFYVWITTLKERKTHEWILLGILLGALTTTRTQDIVLSFPVFLELCVKTLTKFSFSSMANAVKSGVLFLVGAMLTFAPQLIVWNTLYGTLWKSPYLGSNAFDLFNPKLIGVFLNYKTGLLYYSPLIVLSVLGLLLLYKKHRFIILTILSTFALQYYVIASWSGWHQGEAYGMRMLISLYPLLALGFGAVLKKLSMWMSKPALYSIFGLFIIYNFMLILTFQLYIQESSFIYGKNSQEIIVEKVRSIFE